MFDRFSPSFFVTMSTKCLRIKSGLTKFWQRVFSFFVLLYFSSLIRKTWFKCLCSWCFEPFVNNSSAKFLYMLLRGMRDNWVPKNISRKVAKISVATFDKQSGQTSGMRKWIHFLAAAHMYQWFKNNFF